MIELTEAQRLLQRTAGDFARAEIEPIADDIDRDDRFPSQLWPMLGEPGTTETGAGIDELIVTRG